MSQTAQQGRAAPPARPRPYSVMRKVCGLAAATGLAMLLGLAAARAEDIAVSSYPISSTGYPYAVALEKGFFKQEGADVTGIQGTNSGGTAIRALLSGGLAYAEAGPSAYVPAIEQGADLKVVGGGSNNPDTRMIVKAASPIASAKDIKGHKLGFSEVKSSSQSLAILVVDRLGFKPDEVQLVRVGSLGGPMLIAIDNGTVDIGLIGEPDWAAEQRSGKYKSIGVISEILPPITVTNGVTTGKALASRADFVRGVIRGRQKAIDFMHASPDEAAQILAHAYKIDPAVMRASLQNIFESEKRSGIPFWESRIRLDAMDNAVKAQKIVGTMDHDVDWSKMVDDSLLPADLKLKLGGK